MHASCGKAVKMKFRQQNDAYYSHCKKISIYVFPEKELRGLSPNLHIHVSASDLYITTIGPPIFLQQNRQIDHGNI